VTATSVSSLSAEPPTILVCLSLASAASPQIQAETTFGVSILATGHAELADEFARGANVESTAEDSEAGWVTSARGIALRSDAVAAFECETDEVIERHGRPIVMGRVLSVLKAGGSGTLVYWR
jgi:flavin reductase (DIM6/NTAB) family NADH-FMN oxidoreductase RutF